MSSINNIYQTLSKLKIYDLNSKYINAELCAYGVGFSYIENKIDDILKGVFVFLGDDANLKQFELLLGMPIQRSTIPNRRDMICSRLSITRNDYTLEGITRAIRSAGFDTDITEVPQSGKIKIVNKGFLKDYESFDEIKRQINKVMPVHLGYDFDIGILTWNMFEEKDLNFSELDDNDFSWRKLDINGHKLKGGKK